MWHVVSTESKQVQQLLSDLLLSSSSAAAACISTLSVIVDLDSLMWSAVEIEPTVGARTGHTAVCCPCQFKSRDYNNILVFGGGDNEGKFFSDLFCISVPTNTTTTVHTEILKPSTAS